MKRIVALITSLLILVLFSCNKRKTPLDYLDITFNNKDGMTSVFIDSAKVVRVRIINEKWDKVYYQDTLSDSIFLRLNKLISTALAKKQDSIINHPTCFTSAYNLKLSYKKQISNVLVYNDPTSTYKPLDTLTKMLLKLSRTITKPTSDSLFIFKTFSKIATPPPPSSELTKFVPPKIQ